LLALGVILHFSAVVSVEGGLPEGWRFTSTLPQGNTFHGAWAAGPNDLFIGGEGGVIMRWNGQTWSAMSTPTQKTIFAMHGLSANEVWAVGGDPYGEKPGEMSLILRFNGTTWTEMTPPNFNGQTYSLSSVHAIAPNDVWATPEIGTTPIHFNGVRWEFVNVPSPVSSQLEGSLKGVGAVSANDVFFYGSHGQIVHKAGSQWTLEQKIESGTFSANLLQAIWAPALDRVYIGGNWGQVYRRNANGTWTDLGLAGGLSPSYNVQHIWGRSPTEIYLLAGELIRRYDGTNPPQVTFFTDRKSGQWTGGAHHADGLFCFGRSAVHEFRPDGGAGVLNSLTVSSHRLPYASVDGVTRYSGSQLLTWGDTSYVPGAHPLLTLADGIFHPFEPLPPGMNRQTRISTVSAAGPNDIIVCWDNWAKPGNGIHRWNGVQWSPMQGYFDPGTGAIDFPPHFGIGIWRSPSGTLFAIEPHRILRADAQGNWRQLFQIPYDPPPTYAFTALWGRSDSEVYVSTDNGKIHRFNGSTFTEQAVPGGGRINALGGDATKTYAAGADGRVWYRDGSTWKTMTGVMVRAGDDFTAIATGTKGVFAYQLTPAQYTGGGLGRLWKLNGATATRVIQGISGGGTAKLAAAADGSLQLVAGANYILTDQPAPAGFTLQRVERAATDWVALGSSGAAILPSEPAPGHCLVASWRVDQPSIGLPADLVGQGTPAGQHWVFRTEEWHNQGQALPPVQLRLDYNPALVPAGAATESAALYRYDGAAWSSVAAMLVPPAAIRSTGATRLSEWTFAFLATPAEPPALAIQFATPTTVQIRWPASSPLGLRGTPSLAAPVTWTAVAATPETIGDQKVVTLPVTGEARFFRLQN
jgi:hypothetical protein